MKALIHFALHRRGIVIGVTLGLMAAGLYALQHIAMWIPDEPSEESRKAMMGYLQQLSLLPDDPSPPHRSWKPSSSRKQQPSRGVFSSPALCPSAADASARPHSISPHRNPYPRYVYRK